MADAGIYIKSNGALVPAATVPGARGSQGLKGDPGNQGLKGDPGGLVNEVAIPATNNLNTYMTPGTYLNTSANATTAGTNTPGVTPVAGHLTVIGYSGQYVEQIYTVLNGDVTYIRTTQNSGTNWTTWKQAGSVTEALLDGVDLDTMTTGGVYFRGSSAGATAALHYPADGWAGYLEVITRDPSYILQRATAIISALPLGATTGRNVWYRTRYGATWGPWVRATSQGDVGAGDLTGTGSPEGVLTAPVGTYYTDTAGTNGAWRWLKKSGTGNTGWDCSIGDTGWRAFTYHNSAGVVTGVPYPTGMTPNAGVAGGLYVRRVGNRVQWQMTNVTVASGATCQVVLPAGFTCAQIGSGMVETLTVWSGPTILLRSTGQYLWMTASANTNIGAYATGIDFTTDAAWPLTLP